VRSVLVVAALTSTALAQPASPVRRNALVWSDISPPRPQHEADWQFGIGASTWHSTADVIVGYHVFDRLQLRVRERVFAHEGEVAVGLDRIRRDRSWIAFPRTRVFVLAGAGIDNERNAYPFAGPMVRWYRFSNVDFLALEIGARTLSITRTEIFASVSVVK
jgi:hypothetical protein